MDQRKSTSCIGCGAILPDQGGPTHKYLGSSPACWAVYSEVLAREYADRKLFAQVHRLTVDAYAVQHPGRPSPPSIQSVAGHLISLCAVIENSASHDWAARLIGEAVRIKGQFTWLPPPPSQGMVTVADVWVTTGPEEHEKKVREWARSVWTAWSQHHARIRLWYHAIQHQAASN